MRRCSRYFRAQNFAAWLVCLFAAGLVLQPATAHASWWNGDWAARKLITIDTTQAGGGITDPVGTVPVLIRLDVSDFTFDSANPDGSDLRFVAADDKTSLSYHIEKYDNLLGQAFIWVNVPDVKPGAQTSFYLYYGNKKATTPGDNAPATYDGSTVLVYHFADKGAPPHDATQNGNTALKAGQSDDYALIGAGMRMDGQSTVTIPAAPSLAWAAGQSITWSLWFDETAEQPNAILYSRTDGTNIVDIGVNNNVPFISVNGQISNGAAPATPGGWHHLAVLANGSQLTVFVDGAPDGTLSAPLPALNSIAYLGGDATTGATPTAPPTTPPAPPSPAATTPPPPSASPTAATPPPTPTVATTGFIGSVDELEISNSARPLGYIKFAAVGQGNNPLAGKLISFGAEEKPASFFSGTFAVILGSVTPDGWVIIGILALMALVSWVVMADKISYVNTVSKANGVFVSEFRTVGADLIALATRASSQPAPPNLKTLQKSPLYHIYRLGTDEIAKRLAGGRRPGSLYLSAESIAAIRSTLDGGLVRETQKLNKSMVLLTIAISGGPFLGLLGTVVGVMITFATIAEAGNVNVNAIAPGISAALVATVAGLIVAIPALFGYNYLNSRISNGTSDMLVFVDEFVTRMAETYSPVTGNQAAE